VERYAFAKSLAHRAGSRALEWFRRRGELTIDLKGPQDFVTHADREVQALIEREIAGAFPGDAFLGEETAPAFRGPLDHCWIVDPIDGTHNFLRGVPYWNIAIAYTESGRTRFGVVYDPVHNELYCARRGEGAWCESDKGSVALAVAKTRALAGAFVALGHHDRAPAPRYLEIRKRMMEAGVSMRNFGSAALQLAHVASGRLDGFVELALSTWDAAAGLMVVEEAGGYAAPFAPETPTAKARCLACAPGIATALRGLVEQG
jgi:myo-inositol-1(or 4)-monophosphatase